MFKMIISIRNKVLVQSSSIASEIMTLMSIILNKNKQAKHIVMRILNLHVNKQQFCLVEIYLIVSIQLHSQPKLSTSPVA